MQKLAWGAKVSPEFIARLYAICEDFHWPETHPSFLMSCMAFESGETFSPSILNAAGSGATGLIQFMPTTAHYLGTTTAQLQRMSAVDQLSYVRDYFRPYAHRISSLSDMYMAILLPKYVGKPGDSILFSEGVSYRQNSGLDDNHDGRITKDEAAAKVMQKFVKGMSLGYVL